MKHIPAECIFNIYDHTLMAIFKTLQEWGPECEGAAYQSQLITDYKNFEYFRSKKLLNCRQAHWSECLRHFDYQGVYRPGKLHEKADALTRRPGDLPARGDERLTDMAQVVPKPQTLLVQLRLLADGPPAQLCPSTIDIVNPAYDNILSPGKIAKAILREWQP
jgi:hypothetical protein